MNLHEEIAKVAYEIYLKSGCVPGRDSENWLDAERIVLTRHASQDIEEPEGEEMTFADKEIADEIEGTGLLQARMRHKEDTPVAEEVEVKAPPLGTKEDMEARTEKTQPIKRTAARAKKEAPKGTGQKSRKKYN